MWADDGALIERLLAVSKATGLPLVAAGDVLMHVRSRKPLQDTLTAVRLKQPIAECGFALARNAEQHLRSRLRLARSTGPMAAGERRHRRRAAASRSTNCAMNIPTRSCPTGETPTSHLRKLTEAGAREALRGRTCRSSCRSRSRTS